MRLLICLLAILLAAVVAAQRPSIAMTPMDWSGVTFSNYNILHVATKKDLLVFQHYTNSQMEALRRNNEGSYENVANFTDFASPQTTTNGKWTLVRLYPFKVDENNEFYSPGSQLSIRGGTVLSDDTIVGWDGNIDVIVTLRFDEQEEDWIEISEVELTVPESALQLVNTIASFSFTDKHFIFPENGEVQIYERLANLSWNLVHSVPVNNSPVFGKVTYNDVDAFVYALQLEDGDNVGVLLFYTKIGNQWIEQTFTAASLGLRPVVQLGSSVVFLDAENVLISAALEGGGSTESGKVVLISRNSDGVWEPKVDLTGAQLFGYGIGVNDYDIIVPSLALRPDTFFDVTFNTLPRCFYKPINVTCHDQQTADCSSIILGNLFTNNDALCSAGVNVTSTVTNLDAEKSFVEFKFSREFAQDYYCNVTVICPAANNPSSSPSTTGQPNNNAGSPGSQVSGSDNGKARFAYFFLLLSVFLIVV